ncbi:adenosylcobinamide amidohydrolase [bacterium LRH843]|nr:adenosylcobinamide amidohydrolase [bacterium LRH843]
MRKEESSKMKHENILDTKVGNGGAEQRLCNPPSISAIDELTIEHTPERIYIRSNCKWKTLSSAVLGAGFGYHHSFLNRHVDKTYNCDEPEKEFTLYIQNHGMEADTLAMMTAARLEDAEILRSKEGSPDILVMVSTGTSNAVDASKAFNLPDWNRSVGTINTWVFIEGSLPEAAYVQALITVTEAKTKALHDEDIRDSITGTIATGTSTDSVMIASTSSGPDYPYAGTVTQVGKEIAKLVYEGMRTTIRRNKKRLGES